MRKLYLHIGSHKTATTSIQKTLLANRKLLKKNNIGLFLKNRNGSLSTTGNLSSWIFAGANNSLIKTPEGAKIFKPELLAQKLSKVECENVIMSTENFSWIYNGETIKEFAEHLKAFFDEIIIIIYIRRQDQLIISHYNHASKDPSLPANAYYSGDYYSIPQAKENYDEYLDFNQRIALWENAFGIENIKIRIFEKDMLIEKDAVTDFFHLLGITKGFQSEIANVSNGIERTKIGHIINKALPNNEITQLIRKGANNSGKALPSKEEAKAFYLRYADSNKKLNARYKLSNKHADIFNNDFSSYPDNRTDTWDEKSANDAIVNIFKSIHPLLTIRVEDLRDAAIAMEKVNLDASYRLMLIAHKLRPSGTLIKEKVNEYRKKLKKS